MLSQFPRSGRKVPEFDDDDIRELLAYSYRINYRIEEDNVIISCDTRQTHSAVRDENQNRGADCADTR
jgi:plasmid stabilization system protein ParE